MADTTLSTPLNRVDRHDTGVVQVATGAKRYAVVVSSRTANHADVKPCTAAGETFIKGVIDSDPDENSATGTFAVGDAVSLAVRGNVPVLLAASSSVEVGDTIICSATAGVAKKLGAEAKPYDVLGYAAQRKTVGAGGPELCSVRLNIHRQEA